ncbi:hypothetical protein ACIREE_32905 [Streptomyces sp. NPDC102467]|uniref:hypothetical protein n=1 Tax=Streptomyces sp. NPDC102467 TaxID=3366179 RepID=UPI00381ED64C
MERNGVGLATQYNAFGKLKAILLDAHRLGLYDDNPVAGIKPPAAPGTTRPTEKKLPSRMTNGAATRVPVETADPGAGPRCG